MEEARDCLPGEELLEKQLCHWGIKGRSGRYPWGSGEDPYQRITRGQGSQKAKAEKIRKEVARQSKSKLQKDVKKTSKLKKQEAKAESKNYESLEGLLDTASKDSSKRYSDDELRDRINRLKLEKEYRSLVSELNPKVKNKGRKFLEEVGGTILKESVKDVGTQAAKYLLGEGINAITGKPIYKRKGEKDKSS